MFDLVVQIWTDFAGANQSKPSMDQI